MQKTTDFQLNCLELMCRSRALHSIQVDGIDLVLKWSGQEPILCFLSIVKTNRGLLDRLIG